ncbi:hypothetical protein J0A67_03665 [Algoriphagus aestuariicola]|uniref:Glycosyltransferase RgtA/B/C/D-like domain-containing protein n=1 Tax=Algoriphagus aestuariicola TaxID=1852016 RepID=A0ABS3BNW7_9BACT|nr:hypothetical protein [Algoriphagus aestuariicola]MBN7799941.1 hypothetical protein [Algoriphagus aestuariicola]
MRGKFLQSWTLAYDLVVVCLYFFTLAYMIKYFDVQSFDIKVHNFLLQDYLKEGAFPAPPGYYAILYVVDLIFRYKYPFVFSALLVLTFFFWLKFSITFRWLSKQLHISTFQVGLLSASLLFISPIFIPAIDGSFWYLGKFTPTIWHNSTLIAVFPFCLLLFFETLRWQIGGFNKALYSIFFLGLVIILIKPSFMFCYIPALPLYSWSQSLRFDRRFWTSCGFSMSFLAMLFLEKAWIYDLDPMIKIMYTPEERSTVVLDPLVVHLHFSKEPIFDLLCSFPSTLVFMLFWGRVGLKDKPFVFSFLLLVFSLMVYLLLAETGFRKFHGNFYWQIPIAMFLHYLCMVVVVVNQFVKEKKVGIRPFLVFSLVYLIQVAMGIAYWHRIFDGHALN